MLYLTKKGANDEDVASAHEAIKATLAELLGQRSNELDVILSKKDYEERSAYVGGWSEWIRDVVTGINFADRLPRFHSYVVTDQDLGKANASVVTSALQLKKPILYFDTDRKKFETVIGIDEINPESWTSGWTIRSI